LKSEVGCIGTAVAGRYVESQRPHHASDGRKLQAELCRAAQGFVAKSVHVPAQHAARHSALPRQP
jgi:hypothetical protein